MTVLWDVGECPPRKKICLSTSQAKKISQPVDETLMAIPIEAGLMVVGGVDGGSRGGGDAPENPITTLSNLGNTCFLNSVLYTLRFAPSFLHNLHHLALDLQEYSGRAGLKCSSLGRGGKSWSSKDLGSLTGGDALKMQIATDKLHQLYESLRTEEVKDHHSEPFHPHLFLQSLRDVNPIFEGNQQHDAHELLVCLLDNIRETCCQLRQAASVSAVTTAPPPPLPPVKQSWSRQVRKSLSIGRQGRGKGENDSRGIESIAQNGDCCTNGVDYEEESTAVGHNFISEHFEGVSLLRTTCLECEQVTQRKETFCDICVPITTDSQGKDDGLNVNQLYQSALVTEEYLHDSNKYWCEKCLRYNEARRCVKFESLPKLLTLQIKRFSSGYGSVVSKVNEHMPTPLRLGCFCEGCEKLGSPSPDHEYSLYSVIMHLGATMASGHYVAYVKPRDFSTDYESCNRERRKTASLSSAAPDKSSSATAKKKWFFRTPKNGSITESRGQYFRFVGRSSCRGSDCCGVRMREEVNDETWLECDDETVRVISRRQLEEILAGKQAKGSALTPYLLFYSRH